MTRLVRGNAGWKCEICASRDATVELDLVGRALPVKACEIDAASPDLIPLVQEMDMCEDLLNEWSAMAQKDYLENGEDAVPLLGVLFNGSESHMFNLAEMRQAVRDVSIADFKSFAYGFIRKKKDDLGATSYCNVGVAKTILMKDSEVDVEKLMEFDSVEEIEKAGLGKAVDAIVLTFQNRLKIVMMTIPIFENAGVRTIGDATRVEFPNDSKMSGGAMKIF